MQIEQISTAKISHLGILRVTLSEPTPASRLRAIQNAPHEAQANLIGIFVRDERRWDLGLFINLVIHDWIAETAEKRHEAIWELGQTFQRFEERNERKLNIAEELDFHIIDTIRTGKLEEVQTKTGILARVQDQARREGVRSGKDKDTVRKLWNSYRGIVHLGMALDHCENHVGQQLSVLTVAEDFRKQLSESCPKRTSEPYVDSSEQIKFILKSDT